MIDEFVRRVLGQSALPESIPAPVYSELEPGVGHDILPGREIRFVQGDHEYAVEVHAVVDRDYEGQWAYLQICRREHPATTHFGSWEYGFYYRGGDAPWDTWTLDLTFGEHIPSYAKFGEYVDRH